MGCVGVAARSSGAGWGVGVTVSDAGYGRFGSTGVGSSLDRPSGCGLVPEWGKAAVRSPGSEPSPRFAASASCTVGSVVLLVPCSISFGKPLPAASQYSARQATTRRAPVSRSQVTVPSVQAARRCARTGGISSGPSRRRKRGRPAVRAVWERSAGVTVSGSGGDVGACEVVTIRAALRNARPAASARDSSSSLRSAPRSHRVGAGSAARYRRAANAASSVVRPLPGGPTNASTEADPALNAANSRTVSPRSTGSTTPLPAPSRPTPRAPPSLPNQLPAASPLRVRELRTRENPGARRSRGSLAQVRKVTERQPP
ncbi:hypothetical protein a10_09545 [Streptomyces acidiscabies]|nr:hypothetical protein a10_09545 [Streptomyces acidiscabies]